ncbi:MAG: hypothetical protein R3E89_14975 [Thiolinea sp.]
MDAIRSHFDTAALQLQPHADGWRVRLAGQSFSADTLIISNGRDLHPCSPSMSE